MKAIDGCAVFLESFHLTWKIMANYPTQTEQSHLVIAKQQSSETGKKKEDHPAHWKR